MYERVKTLIEERLRADGLTPDEWREGADGLEAVFRNTWQATAELDHGLVSDGEEGALTACVVGSPEHGNEHVAYHFTEEGSDCPAECHPFENVVPV